MKKILLLGLSIFVLLVARAQRVYFIYLQSENSSPFFVKLDDKINSSTAEGYVILSKLVDSTYTFTVGKPGRQAAEAKFSVTINGKDHGYLLRDVDNTLSLFDLQTMATIKATASLKNNNITGEKKTDGFSVLLSQAASDPSLLDIQATPAAQVTAAEPVKTAPQPTKEAEPAEKETAVVKTNPVIADTVMHHDVAVKTDSAVAIVPEATKPVDTLQKVEEQKAAPVLKEEEKITAPVEPPIEYKRSVVSRRSESSTSEGFGLVFLDNDGGNIDTIRILIPNQKYSITENTEPAPPATVAETKTETPVENVKVPEKVKEEPLTVPQKIKASCTAIATDNDFLKLRKYMAAKDTDEGMLGEARRYFKSKCFLTDQVKNLSALFLTEQGKYAFFDAAFGHVSDQEQFGTLQSELKDYYYVNRFKALIGK